MAKKTVAPSRFLALVETEAPVIVPETPRGTYISPEELMARPGAAPRTL